MNGGSRITVTGTFCSLNKGDAAMRMALTSELRKAIPNCHITVMTPFPEIDRAAYSSDQVLRCSRRRPIRAAAMILRALAWRAARRLLGRDMPAILNEELRVYRQSDLVVDLSGDGLTEEYGVKCLFSHLVPIILGKLLGKPVFVCAQTIGPLHRTGSVCRWLLKKVDGISARERLTFDYLSKIGLNGVSLALTADIGFLLEPIPDEQAKEILIRERVPLDRPLVGFAISRLPGHVRGTRQSQEPSKIEMEMAEVLDAVAAMGLQPVIVSHTTGPGERRDDRRAAVRVANLARRPLRIAVLLGDYSAEETKGVIKQMELFVGMRMHSCIAALSSGVPTISIAQGPKAYGVMNLCQQGRWVIDIRQVTAERVTAMIREAWEARAATRESLCAQMPAIRALAQENVAIIKRLLKCEDKLRQAVPQV